MRISLFRRLFMLFVLGAFLCAGFGQPVPTAQASSLSGISGMSMAMDPGDSMPIPCKSTVLNCFTDIGCVFMIALPPAYSPTSTPLAWSRVIYASVASVHSSMSLKPDLGPPIYG